MKKYFLLIITACLMFLFEKDIVAKDHMEILWETEKVFELPESVIFDKENSSRYLVA